MNRNWKYSFALGALFCLSAIIAFLAFTTGLYAGTGLTLTPARVDLGLIDEGVPATAVFVVENKGPSGVVVQGVKTN
ncbi:MAG TPA: hypothetical protein VGJ94_10850 [Syntrophorhabdaceae bacterium]|jgi:hypothetical protein